MKFTKHKLITNSSYSLSEGIMKSQCNNFVSWVDINNRKIVVYDIEKKTSKTFLTKFIPTCILSHTNQDLKILSDRGIVNFNIKENVNRVEFHMDLESQKMRTNDGCIIDKKIIFGTMHLNPKQRSGGVFVFSNGKVKKIDEMGIPNTFIVYDKKILISDSMEQKIYSYDLCNFDKKIWLDLSGESFTPDGGCLSANNEIFICLWGNGKVLKLSFNGEIKKIYKLPSKYLTNCVSIGKSLFISSACEDKKSNESEFMKHQGRIFQIIT